MKNKKIFSCTHCGAQYEKWMGKCLECGNWNTVEEEPERLGVSSGSGNKSAPVILETEPVALRDVGVDADVRIPTGIGEFDLVLGGGLVRGSLVLVGGDPGIGKSTLLLQAAGKMGVRVLYASGEESLRQTKLRAERLSEHAEHIYLVCENRLEQILAAADKVKAEVLVIDSIQTMSTQTSNSAQGSVSQIREATATLMNYAKGKGVSVFIVGHVTKSGSIAGPKLLEHMVDTVLYFEGDFRKMYRVLRAVKNRFGSVSEIGVFEMTGTGLVDVPNPSALFLGEGGAAVILPVIEGSRAMLLEIQCLVSQSFLSNPRRMGAGIDHGKMMLLTAVLEKRLGMPFYQNDIYLNVVGGFEVDEPAADLAIVASLLLGINGTTMRESVIVFGEVGLNGEVRAVSHFGQRIAEASKMGFETAIVPKGNLNRSLGVNSQMKLVGISHVKELLQHLRTLS
ncbi:MAG: DNA repair protein RadA [Bacillota bacterium]|nr:DNA repair protein RadA [Bacillota bacterium]